MAYLLFILLPTSKVIWFIIGVALWKSLTVGKYYMKTAIAHHICGWWRLTHIDLSLLSCRMNDEYNDRNSFPWKTWFSFHTVTHGATGGSHGSQRNLMAYAGVIRFPVYIIIIYTPYPTCLGWYLMVSSGPTGGITFVPIVQRSVYTEQHCFVCVHRRDLNI